MTVPDANAIERAGLKAWPGIDVEWDGAWVRRAANGYTKRANSVQCYDVADGANVEARIAASRQWFDKRGLHPAFRIVPDTPAALSAALDAEGWQTIDHSHVLAMPLGPMAAAPRAEVLGLDDPAFLVAQRRLQGYDDVQLANLRAILDVIEVPAAGIVMHDEGGRAVSSALMAIGDGIVITGNVVTDASQRRKGHGEAMMRTGLAWAWENGATAAALNVMADNVAAQALYGRLGYRHRYGYHYRVPGMA